MILRDLTAFDWRGRSLWSHGNAELLRARLSAVLCSRACPGAKVLEAIDLAQRLRSENRAISGFHTPVEKACLRNFLRGPQQVEDFFLEAC